MVFVTRCGNNNDRCGDVDDDNDDDGILLLHGLIAEDLEIILLAVYKTVDSILVVDPFKRKRTNADLDVDLIFDLY